MTEPNLPPAPDTATQLAGPPAPQAPPAPPAPVPPPTAGAQPLPPSARRRAPAWITVVLAPVLAVVLFAGGAVADRSGWFGGPAEAASPAPTGSAAELALIEQAWQDLHEHYVDAKNLDDQALAYGAISGMTQAVGDVGHTTFLTAAEAKAMDESLSGTFVGIGVRVSGDSSAVTIASVIPGTPAEEAGLRRGDTIVAVDGTSTSGETVDQVVARVRGPEGEKVTLTIQRAGSATFDVTITRRKFDLPLSSWTMVPGRKVAMIRLEQFATGATKAVQDAITKAKAAGATAIILDLRGNPGGYVNEAVGVTSQFVGDGIVYQSIDASGKEQDIPVEPGGLATDIPLVVLADGATASAAEIVTGAIQDAGRGTVVGEKTFGTGTVLGRFDLADGSSLRIGVERWLTRAGRPIWHEGLVPDVTVPLATDAMPKGPDEIRDMTPAELAASGDAQLLKALDLLKGKS
jgi:carboxyl-terminal processing protease